MSVSCVYMCVSACVNYSKTIGQANWKPGTINCRLLDYHTGIDDVTTENIFLTFASLEKGKRFCAKKYNGVRTMYCNNCFLYFFQKDLRNTLESFF